jgi:ABC-type nitrate/sulfonate/bicarbonate transport system permease component
MLGNTIPNRLREHLPPSDWRLVSVIAGLLLWEVIGRIVGRIFFAPLSLVVQTWADLILSGALPQAVAGSLQHMFIGYFVGVGLAIPLGLLMGQSKIIRWIVNPYIDALYATPTIAYLPLIIVWFGLGFNARVFFVFIFCFFEVLINTYQGISELNESYFDVGTSFDLSWWQFQRNIFFPATLPYIFAGFRLGIGRAVRGMISAEIFLAVVYLGELLTSQGATLNTAQQLAIIGTVALMGVIGQMIVKRIEQRAIPWAKGGAI